MTIALTTQSSDRQGVAMGKAAPQAALMTAATLAPSPLCQRNQKSTSSASTAPACQPRNFRESVASCRPSRNSVGSNAKLRVMREDDGDAFAIAQVGSSRPTWESVGIPPYIRNIHLADPNARHLAAYWSRSEQYLPESFQFLSQLLL